MSGPRILRTSLALFALLAVAAYGASGFFVVKPEEEAIVLRFGRAVRTAGPGLRYRLPVPFESHLIESVSAIRVTSIGYKIRDEINARLSSVPWHPPAEETEFLAGDQNLVAIELEVNYTIRDMGKYSLAWDESAAFLIRWIGEGALTEILAGMNVDEVFSRKGEVAGTLKQLTQQRLDRLETGIELFTVTPRRVDAPIATRDVFLRVNDEKNRIDEVIRKANEFAVNQIAMARSDGERIRNEARSEAGAAVARAASVHSKFSDLEGQFRLSPETTRRRLFLENLREVLPAVRLLQVGEGGNLELFLKE